jgi:hypothetical protein
VWVRLYGRGFQQCPVSSLRFRYNRTAHFVVGTSKHSSTTYLCTSSVARLIPVMYPPTALALSLRPRRVHPGHATVVRTLELDPPPPPFLPASASSTADLNLVNFFVWLVPCCIDTTGPGLRRSWTTRDFAFIHSRFTYSLASFFSYKFEPDHRDLSVFLIPLYLRSLVENLEFYHGVATTRAVQFQI